MVKSRNLNFNYHDNLYMADETHYSSLSDFLDESEKEGFDLIVIDSLRAASHDVEGGKNQREIEALILMLEWVKRTGKNIIAIGMVTKDDDFAGSNDLMHYVDAHLHLQFDKKTNERYLFFDQKNRDGKVQERVYYDFNESGFIEFMTEEEWLTQKNNHSLHDSVQESVEKWISGWKNHKKFNDFKKALNEAQNNLLKERSFSNQTEFLCHTTIETQKLVEKFFL